MGDDAPQHTRAVSGINDMTPLTEIKLTPSEATTPGTLELAKNMGLLLLVVIIFLLLGGVGFGLHGTLGTVLIVLAVLWLVGGIGFHGSRSGWYGGGRGL